MLQPPIDAESHRELHKQFAAVPPPDHFMAERVERLFVPVLHDYLGSLDNLIYAVDEASNNPNAREIERHIGGLIIATLEMQRPYIKEGLVT